MQNINVCGIVLAAGSGSRMNSDIKKQFIEVNGKPLIYYSLKAISSCDKVKELIIVTKKDDINYMNKIVSEYNFDKVVKIIANYLPNFEHIETGKSLDSKM